MIGTTIAGRYRIARELKKGGMGAVYVADDLRSPSTTWAVKIALPGSNSPEENAENLELARQEADFLRELNHSAHPNILWFQDSFASQSDVKIIMELVQGGDLDGQLRAAGGAGLPPSQVIPWMVQVADAIGCLHRRPGGAVIYRDLKPANLMIDGNGVIKLVDYGIARRHKPKSTKDTILLGTPQFAAPELMQREPGQSATDTDVYSLGATMFNLLTGILPVTCTTPNPGEIRARNSAVSLQLEALVIQMMQQKRHSRIQTMDVVRTHLLGVADSSGVTVPPTLRTCPFCRTANRVAASFCRTCGSGLIRFASTAAQGLQAAGSPPSCPQCRTAVRPGTKFCHVCGRRH